MTLGKIPTETVRLIASKLNECAAKLTLQAHNFKARNGTDEMRTTVGGQRIITINSESVHMIEIASVADSLLLNDMSSIPRKN